MPFSRQWAHPELSGDMRSRLETIGHRRSESAHRIERARILLSYAEGKSVSAIARELQTKRRKTERCEDKELHLGANED